MIEINIKKRGNHKLEFYNDLTDKILDIILEIQNKEYGLEYINESKDNRFITGLYASKYDKRIKFDIMTKTQYKKGIFDWNECDIYLPEDIDEITGNR